MLADTVTRLLRELGRQPAVQPLVTAALTRGLVVVVGDGATRPDLTARLVAALGAPVHRAAAPHTAALTGASLAAARRADTRPGAESTPPGPRRHPPKPNPEGATRR
jgi:rod shape-determining protein MreB